MTDRTCSIDGCDNQHRATGLCHTHYMRQHRGRDTGPADLLQIDPGTSEREFMRLFNRITDDCIVWEYGRTGPGYGAIHFGGRKWLAHRLALVMYTGVEPGGMVSLHGPCHNRACINARAGHVTWGTQKQNVHDRWRDGTATWAA